METKLSDVVALTRDMVRTPSLSGEEGNVAALVAERMLKRMASKIRDASNYRAILGIPNAFQRVFALLNQFAKIAPGGLVVIEKMPTQQEIAIMVNTSRETVSRAIHALIQKGVVEKDMRRLIVRIPEALREAVNAEQDSAMDNS